MTVMVVPLARVVVVVTADWDLEACTEENFSRRGWTRWTVWLRRLRFWQFWKVEVKAVVVRGRRRKVVRVRRRGRRFILMGVLRFVDKVVWDCLVDDEFLLFGI